MNVPLRPRIALALGLAVGMLAQAETRAADASRALEDEYLRQEAEFVRKALLLAEMYEAAGNVYSAREIYEKVVALRPRESAAVDRLARLYRAGGEAEKIVRLYERLVEQDSGNIAVLMKLADAQSDAGMRDAEMATYEKVLGIRANSPGAFVEIGQTLMREGAYDAAAALLAHGIDLHPFSVQLYYARSDLRFRRGDFAGAAEDAGEVAARAPEESLLARQGSVMLAEALVAGKLVEAHFARVTAEVASLERRHARALADLGETLRKENRVQESLAAYSELLRLYPDSEAAETARSQLRELSFEGNQ
ncbi:MAG: tetratricopeptide repeat protein [Planctomycetota bacterium]